MLSCTFIWQQHPKLFFEYKLAIGETSMGQQHRKVVKRQRRNRRDKRVKARRRELAKQYS